MLKGACCIAVSVLLFLPLALWLYSSAPMPQAKRAALAQQFVHPERCRPEPGERRAYLAGIVFLPACLFGLAFAWRRWAGRLPSLPGLALAAEVALAAALAVFAWLALLADDYRYLRLNPFFVRPLLAVPLLPAAFLALRWDLGGRRWVRPAVHALALGLTALPLLASLYNDRSPYTGAAHFSAVFYPVVAVCQGRALLIDCASQYGLYPHLLQPLFALTGLSVLSFTAVMGLLLAASYLGLWLFLARASGNRTAAFVGFASLLLNGWFSFFRAADFNPYFQYLPIRFVFPALLVPLGWRYLRRPTRGLYWGLLAFLAAGVLWNLDSGLPALLAWAATLCFAELCGGDGWAAARRVAGHLGAATAVPAGAFLLYSAAIRLAYGAFPDYGQFLVYQRLYFAAGFMKLPMQWPGAWALVALVYLAGLAHAAFALAARRGTPRAKVIFLLSVLGIGLSSYYQGRSHPNILLLVGWPGCVLLALFLDDVLARLKERPVRPMPWLAAAALGWFLVGSACGLAPAVGQAATVLAAKYRADGDPSAPPQREAETALLRRAVPPGDKVFIAAPQASFLHLASGRPGLSPSTILQMVRMDEFRELDGLLDKSPSTPVLVDQSVFGLTTWATTNRGLRLFVDMLREKYEITGEAGDSYLFGRRAGGASLLGPDPACSFQVGVRGEALAGGLAFAPCSPRPPWSLEVVMKPSADEAPYAAVVGNHPGNGTGGFVLHHEGAGACALVAGDGKAWRRVLGFGVAPGAWNYIALVHDGQAVTAYVNGTPVASASVADFTIEDSPLPLQVGNWCGGDRPFRGQIREVRILGRALSAAEIAQTAERIPARLP
jgi:concanavalin A-like lectin/glucanase superfamily protein